MKNVFIAVCLILGLGVYASAEILVFSPNGAYVKKATLAEANSAADVAGKTVVVTSPLSAVQSNISSATVHGWRTDAALKVEKGGCVAPTTTFTGLPTAEVGWFCNAAGTPAAGDGATDDTLAVQNAVNSTTKLIVPMTENGYRTTAAINITKPITIQGSGTFPYSEVGPADTRGSGSWFYLDHTGTGFLISNNAGTNFIASVRIQGIGTYRNHTTPIGTGWAPTVCGYDFVARNTDIFYDDVMILNAYKAINHTHGSAGRVIINNVRGQWFNTGINIDKALDVVRINNLHHWPFWSNDASVTSYQQTNTDVIVMKRCDNPQLSNVFSIYSKNGILLSETADGKTSKIHGVNVDLDLTLNSLLVDATVTGATGQFVNMTSNGPPTASADSYNIRILGNSCRFDFQVLEGADLSHGLINVEGTYNEVKITSPRANIWDKLELGSAIISADATNTVRVTNVLQADAVGSPGTVFFNPLGVIKYPQFVTSGTASITSGNTSVVVDHGLPFTPSATQIQMWMISALGSASVAWIDTSTITATQFTIRVNTNPAATIFINWRAALE